LRSAWAGAWIGPIEGSVRRWQEMRGEIGGVGDLGGERRLFICRQGGLKGSLAPRWVWVNTSLFGVVTMGLSWRWRRTRGLYAMIHAIFKNLRCQSSSLIKLIPFWSKAIAVRGFTSGLVQCLVQWSFDSRGPMSLSTNFAFYLCFLYFFLHSWTGQKIPTKNKATWSFNSCFVYTQYTFLS